MTAAALLILASATLGGCVTAALVGTAVSALVGGGAPSSDALGMGAPYEAGRGLEQAAQAVADQSAREVTPICRARLDDLPQTEPQPAGSCGIQPVCLPGASAPTPMMMCLES